MSAKAGSFRSSGFKEVERKQGKPFYCVTWCKDIFTSQDRKKSFYYFATCGGVNLSIFETEIGAGSKNYRLKHSYYDKDETEDGKGPQATCKEGAEHNPRNDQMYVVREHSRTVVR